MKTLRVVVVDDEAVARESLRAFITEVPWLSYEGEAADGASAAETIDTMRPDLVFLDVRLPVMSGVEVLERIAHRPAVVFTTAHDEYAIRALQLGAIDYLLKPFGRIRFLEAVARIRDRLETLGQIQGEGAWPREPLAGARPLRRLFVRNGELIMPVELADVERIEAADDYVCFHHGGTRHLAHVTLAELHAALDPERFIRIHRSHVVNLDHIAALEDFDPRRFVVRLRSGATIVASRAGTRLLRGIVR